MDVCKNGNTLGDMSEPWLLRLWHFAKEMISQHALSKGLITDRVKMQMLPTGHLNLKHFQMQLGPKMFKRWHFSHSVALSTECCQPVFMGSNEMDSLLKTVKWKSMATFSLLFFH